ncbi:MAG: hypothetical protein HY901_32730 [Deltaproteobacteria bacterium]|nr:hypothetical protein [Deltaproteobacteria bacterium]
MPALRVVVGGTVGDEDLEVALLPDQARWKLSVHRAQHLVLERTLPGEASPDAAFFVACAAVIERFLEEIDWAGKPEKIDPGAVARLPSSPPPPSPPLKWSVGAGVAGAAGFWPGALRIGPALDLAVRRSVLWASLRAHLYAPASHAASVPNRTRELGEVRELPVALAALGGACWGERWALCGGAQLGWRGTWAWSTGGRDLYSPQNARSDSLLGGLFGLGALPLPYQLQLRALLTASGFLGGGEIALQGADLSPAAGPPRFEVGLSLSLAREIP